jgi:hypothetical protein
MHVNWLLGLTLFVLPHQYINYREFALSICFVIFASLPFYLRLKEKKVAAEPRVEFLMKFWTQIRRRACWQVILCKSNTLGCNIYSIMIATHLTILILAQME